MRIKTTPEDFRVEEQVRLPLDRGGAHTLYRVRKRAATTMEVAAGMAQALGRPPSDVRFPALKDRVAVSVQHATVRGSGPARIVGEGFVAERIGRASRPLRPSDLQGNRFVVVVRDLALAEAEGLSAGLEELARAGLPNYFGQQRFGSRTSQGDWPGRRILRRDAEGALQAHLAEVLAGDPPPVRAFKRVAAEQWSDWDALLQAAPRPSNFRSVLTYLRDHPTDFRRALNLVTPRLLGVYLAAYQSLLWNRTVARYLGRVLGPSSSTIVVGGERLPLPPDLAARVPAEAAVPLPHHRASYDDPVLAGVAARVLEEEGLTPTDLKPRLLRRAYLSKGSRWLVLRPTDLSTTLPVPDERFPGRHQVTLTFALPRGSYATLVLAALRCASASERGPAGGAR